MHVFEYQSQTSPLIYNVPDCFDYEERKEIRIRYLPERKKANVRKKERKKEKKERKKP